MAALAPSVSFPLAGHRPTLCVVAGLLALWGVALLLWLQAWGWRWTVMPWPWWLMVGAGLVTALVWALRWRSLRSMPQGVLVWEPSQRHIQGQLGVWRLLTPAWPTGLRASQVAVVLDLQRLVLVQFQAPQGLRLWCWLWQGSDPPYWLAIRRALLHQPTHPSALQRI